MDTAKSWRPEGWRNPYTMKLALDSYTPLVDMPEAFPQDFRFNIYEAGAEAMLEALKKAKEEAVNAKDDSQGFS